MSIRNINKEADALESDLWDYHRKRGVTSQAYLATFFRRWILSLREHEALMCNSLEAVSPFGDPIEVMTVGCP
jgi:hypothetical protein